ncbi:extracellular solute-binding protein [Calothrix sp. UHCC 0171]|uniref:extracellular solute-binding protein n=1 Tax=Calothrix sp. UHCC 0171 TaxID=3110245 RepID=UPI002B20B3C3|nr:extracellular solute-binding protein [Calothrix sp. UHCC 0171]MEA5569786.1 extracellular solute-binding protein [Calothrix sp. UHCC 0171]
MDRRSFLITTSTFALSQLLLGCGGKNQPGLTVDLLKYSLPNQVIGQFRRNLQKDINLKNMQVDIRLVEQLRDVFKKLESWQNKHTSNDKNWVEGISRRLQIGKPDNQVSADLLTLGDFWLKPAIEAKLIQPLDIDKIQQWSTLPKQWQDLVTRNDRGFLDKQGKVWAAPYRWGNTVIIYHRDKFEKNGWKPPTDWADLWRAEFRDRISLLNHPREVIGLVLKKLGKSYNTTDLSLVRDLEEELQQLHQQVKFYGSTKYIEPLIIGDTLIAQGWSQDILPNLSRYPYLGVIVPNSGTAMWADVWVQPTGRQSQAELLKQWISFFWQPNIAKEIMILTKTNSPIPTNITASDIQEPLRNILLANQDTFAKSEFLLPLPIEAEKQYNNLFNQLT